MRTTLGSDTSGALLKVHVHHRLTGSEGRETGDEGGGYVKCTNHNDERWYYILVSGLQFPAEATDICVVAPPAGQNCLHV